MKTPDEIKKGLECCTIPVCAECPYDSEASCVVKNEDALAYIQQLEAGIAEWEYVAASPGAVEDMAREIDRLEMQKRQTAKRIQQLEAKVPKWISVKDQMPTGEDPVLILVKETEHYGWQKEKWKVYYCQYMAYWDGDEWFTTWCNGCRKISDTAKEPYADDYEVTHWMPLPEPPAEE